MCDNAVASGLNNEATIALYRHKETAHTLYSATSCLQWQKADLHYVDLLSAVIYMQRSREGLQIKVKVQLSEPHCGLKPPSLTLELNEEAAEQSRTGQAG